MSNFNFFFGKARFKYDMSSYQNLFRKQLRKLRHLLFIANSRHTMFPSDLDKISNIELEITIDE
jgi:hypothetical protein